MKRFIKIFVIGTFKFFFMIIAFVPFTCIFFILLLGEGENKELSDKFYKTFVKFCGLNYFF